MQVVLIKALNSGEKWTCTECDYKHKRRGYLLNHIEREHMTEDFPGYGCLRCQQVWQLELSTKTQNIICVSTAKYKDPKQLLERYIVLLRSRWRVMRSTST